MNRRIILLVLITTHFIYMGYGQFNDTFSYKAKNSVYTELFGHGFIYSINYDRLLGFEKKLGYGYRIGFGGDYPLNNTIELFDDGFSSIPFGLYFLYGKRKHYLEGDFSIIPSFGGSQGGAVDFGLGIAYRLQPYTGGLFFTAGAIFQTGNIADFGSYAFPKIGFGYTFDKNIDPTSLPPKQDRDVFSEPDKEISADEKRERENRPKRSFAHVQFLKRNNLPLETIILYERLLLEQGLFSLTAGVGFGAGKAECRTGYIPLELSVLFGKVIYLELTGNSLYVISDNEFCQYDWSFISGYRYGIRFQPPKGKLVVRLGVTYLPNFAIDNRKAHLAASIGMAF